MDRFEIWHISEQEQMDIWDGWFGIFEDKIPAFRWMDGGEPSGGGFYAKEFPAPAQGYQSSEKPFMGCETASL